jgi:hypothetical protein
MACLNKLPNEGKRGKSVVCVPLCMHREAQLLTLNPEKYQKINEEQLLHRRHLEVDVRWPELGQDWTESGSCHQYSFSA